MPHAWLFYVVLASFYTPQSFMAAMHSVPSTFEAGAFGCVAFAAAMAWSTASNTVSFVVSLFMAFISLHPIRPSLETGPWIFFADSQKK